MTQDSLSYIHKAQIFPSQSQFGYKLWLSFVYDISVWG